MSEKVGIKTLESMGEKWLEGKIQRMKNLLKIAEPDEALYREIMLSLGYPENKINFLELALMTPYSEIRKLGEKLIIERALLYRANFSDDKTHLPPHFDCSLRLDRSVWEYKGIRPANFPEKRITGITDLLAKTTAEGLTVFFIKRLKAGNNYQNSKLIFKKIMDFEGIGHQRKEEMFFNIIMPFFWVCSEDVEIRNLLKFMFENYPPLSDNKLIKDFKTTYQIAPSNVKEYMGAVFFQKIRRDF